MAKQRKVSGSTSQTIKGRKLSSGERRVAAGLHKSPRQEDVESSEEVLLSLVDALSDDPINEQKAMAKIESISDEGIYREISDMTLTKRVNSALLILKAKSNIASRIGTNKHDPLEAVEFYVEVEIARKENPGSHPELADAYEEDAQRLGKTSFLNGIEDRRNMTLGERLDVLKGRVQMLDRLVNGENEEVSQGSHARFLKSSFLKIERGNSGPSF